MTAHYTNATNTTHRAVGGSSSRSDRRQAADPVGGYIAQFSKSLTLRLRSQRVNHHDIDDIVQTEATRLWLRYDAVTAKYPNAEVYAALRARKGQALTDHLRKQGTQRGTGAIVQKDQNTGAVVKGRTVISGDQAYTRDAFDPTARDEFTGSCFDRYAFEHPMFDSPDAFSERDELLEAALLKVSPRQRMLVLRVKVADDTVAEVAADLGITRETASRDLNAAMRAIAAELRQGTTD